MLVPFVENLQQTMIELEDEDDLKAQRNPFPPTIPVKDGKEGFTGIWIPSGKLVQLRYDSWWLEGINPQTNVWLPIWDIDTVEIERMKGSEERKHSTRMKKCKDFPLKIAMKIGRLESFSWWEGSGLGRGGWLGLGCCFLIWVSENFDVVLRGVGWFGCWLWMGGERREEWKNNKRGKKRGRRVSGSV